MYLFVLVNKIFICILTCLVNISGDFSCSTCVENQMKSYKDVSVLTDMEEKVFEGKNILKYFLRNVCKARTDRDKFAIIVG